MTPSSTTPMAIRTPTRAPEPRTFVRQEISIDHVDGDSAMLSDGPPAGTEVVTVGAAEVYGTEFEVAH